CLVDLDPRWVNQLIRDGRPRELEAYKRHVVEQGLALLRAHASIRCLFTTPKLLAALAERVDLPRLGIRGVFCGGTEMSPQFHRFAREELIPGLACPDLGGAADPGDPVIPAVPVAPAAPAEPPEAPEVDADPAARWAITYY